MGVPAGHADVDARVAGLPGATLAERRGDRAVDRPDHRPGSAADRAGADRRTLLGRAQLRLDLRLHLREVALEMVPVDCTRERIVRRPSRAPWRSTREDTSLPLTAATWLRRASMACAAAFCCFCEHAELLRLARRLPLQVADLRDDLVVLVRDAVQELRALEQVGEAVRLEHDGQRIGLAVLVHLHEPRGEHLLRTRQVELEPRKPVARLLQACPGSDEARPASARATTGSGSGAPAARGSRPGGSGSGGCSA